jgi:hypothetical protein
VPLTLSVDHFSQKTIPGNMDILLHHSKLTDGLILSSGEITAIEELNPDSSLSTDVPAFYATMDLPHCKTEMVFPRQGLRWSQCSLQHANTRFRMAANGFAKYKRIQSGNLIVFFATPLKGNKIGDGAAFSREGYNEELPPETRWTIQAAPLLPGTTL